MALVISRDNMARDLLERQRNNKAIKKRNAARAKRRANKEEDVSADTDLEPTEKLVDDIERVKEKLRQLGAGDESGSVEPIHGSC